MNKPKIPSDCPDIRADIRRRIMHDILVIIAVRVLVFVPAYMYGYYTSPINIFGVIAVEAICVLPIFTTRIWKWFTSARAFEGEVIEVKRRTGNEVTKQPKMSFQQTPTKAMRRTPTAGRSRQVIKVHIQKIKVRLPDGKIRRVKYVCPDGVRIPQYEVGDRVRHYYGTNYMLRLMTSTDAPLMPNICVMCGAINKDDDEVCGFCGMSIPSGPDI